MKSRVSHNKSLVARYKRYLRQFNRYIEDGTFWRFRHRKRKAIIHRLKKLQRKLQDWEKGVKASAIGAAMLFAALPMANAQFTENEINPFGGASPTASDQITVDFVDIDGDGDFDIFTGGWDGTMKYYQNGLSSSGAIYTTKTGTDNPFNGVDVGTGSAPRFVDIDNDGDQDCFIGNYDGTISYYENTGSSSAPGFTSRTGTDNPFNGVDVGFHSMMTFKDTDNDGDQDAYSGETDGIINYFENTGSAGSPGFAQRTGTDNPLNGLDAGSYSTPYLVDWDNDGDFDMFVGEGGGTIVYYKNTGSTVAPAYANQTGTDNPFNGVDAGNYSVPVAVDIDGDSDFDVFVADDTYQDLNFYKNTGSSGSGAITEVTGIGSYVASEDVGTVGHITFGDLDNDGDQDAFAGNYNGNVYYYKNNGSNTSPSYEQMSGTDNPMNGVTVTYHSRPDLVDIDNDNDLDLFIAYDQGLFKYYENTGNSTTPEYTERTGASNPFNGIDVGTNSNITFADLDNDGDFDAMTGEYDGVVTYYENTGSAGSPDFALRTGTDNPLNSVSTGAATSSHPSLFDYDNDGDYDAAVGEYWGTIEYWENTGSTASPEYTERTGTDNPFNGVDVGEYAAPAPVNIDNNGAMDMFIGANSGTFTFLQKDGFLVLPVELLSFTASAQGDDVLISWSTATEINNNFFELSRSFNGTDYEVISEIDGAGNSETIKEYEFTDEAPGVGTIYYRLRQVDFNGDDEVFDPIAVQVGNAQPEANEVLVFPNPIQAGDFRVQMSEALTGEVRFVLIDIMGREVVTWNRRNGAADTQIQLELGNDIHSGYYQLIAYSDDQMQFKKRLIIE